MKSNAAVPSIHLTPIEQVRPDVTQRLLVFLGARLQKASSLDADYGDLWAAMHQLAQAGGKRLRPYLVCLGYQSFGGQNYQQAIELGAAYELLHLAMLAHDDIIDKDYVRYGQLNVAGQQRAKYLRHRPRVDHYANSAALLAGDLLLNGAQQMILESSLSDTAKLAALKELGEAIFMVGGGELIDMESVLLPPESAQPIKIAELKTAYYSFIAPLTSGARLAGASPAQLRYLAAFGLSVGVAFQLADDLLGIFGDPKLTGKSVTGDIREGKRTFLMNQALELARPADRRFLQQSLGNQRLTQQQAARVRQILEQTGAREATRAAIQTYADHSRKALQKLAISDIARQTYDGLITRATERLK